MAKKTSPKAASAASKVLADPKSTKQAKSAAGSDLVQVDKKKTTSQSAASKASKTLSDVRSNKGEKTAAASALSQKEKPVKRK